MATRSTIWIKTGETYKGIYCHNDGYLAHNGAILLMHYNNADLVNELINGGNISSLGASITPNENKPHSFDAPQHDVTIFYARDRGEELNTYNVFDVVLFEEYNYLFDAKANKWIHTCNEDFFKLTETDILIEWDCSGYIYPAFAIKQLKKLIKGA